MTAQLPSVGEWVALRSDPTITGTVRGYLDTPNFGRLVLVSWLGPDDVGEPEHPDHLVPATPISRSNP